MDKALNYMSLARKASRIELGEEMVGAAARAQHAVLVAVAADAADHTWRRAKSFVAGTRQQCIRAPFTKNQMGMAVGRMELAIAAFTDPALALAFTEALGNADKYRDALEELSARTRAAAQRRTEEKAHQRNKRRGRSPKPGRNQQ